MWILRNEVQKFNWKSFALDHQKYFLPFKLLHEWHKSPEMLCDINWKGKSFLYSFFFFFRFAGLSFATLPFQTSLSLQAYTRLVILQIHILIINISFLPSSTYFFFFNNNFSYFVKKVFSFYIKWSYGGRAVDGGHFLRVMSSRCWINDKMLWSSL